MRVVVDIASNRIVWFTSGDDPLVLTDATALVEHEGAWPEEITQQNCWNWVLRDRKLVPHEAPPPETLHESNKRQTERLLRVRINEKRKRITADMEFEETIQIKKLEQAREYLNSGTSSWLLARLSSTWGIGMKDAAQRIIDEWVSKERMLMQTEAQLAEYLHRLDATKTSSEVLALHEEITRV